MARATARLVKTHLRAAAAVIAIVSALFLAAGTTALAQQATLSQASSLSFSDAEEILVVELEPDFFWIELSPGAGRNERDRHKR